MDSRYCYFQLGFGLFIRDDNNKKKREEEQQQQHRVVVLGIDVFEMMNVRFNVLYKWC